MVDDNKKNNEELEKDMLVDPFETTDQEQAHTEVLDDAFLDGDVADEGFIDQDDFLDEGMEDDFFDDDGSFSEDEFGDDPFDDADFGDGASDAGAKKSGGNDFIKKHFNTIIYAVGGLIGAYVVYSTLFPGGGDVAQQQMAMNNQPASIQAPANMMNPGVATPSLEKEEEKPESVGLLMGGLDQYKAKQAQKREVNQRDNVDVAQAPMMNGGQKRTEIVSAKKWQQPPMPTPISRDSNQSSMIDRNQEVVEDSRVEAQLSEDSVRSNDGERFEDQSQSVMTRVDVPEVVQTSSSVVDNEQVQELESKLAQVEQEYMDLSEKFDRLSQMLEERMQEPVAPSVSNEDVKRLEQKIAFLEKQLEEKEAPSVASQAKKPKRTTSSAPVKSSSKPKASYVLAPRVMKGVKPAEKPFVVSDVADAWVLRAAQTGVAWISKDFSSPIQKVFIGQEIEGMGQVLNISVQQGRWVVETSKGNIVQ